MSIVELSSGSRWKPQPGDAPYLLADPGSPWPVGADAWAVFYDTSGGVITTIYADSVAADFITFDADPNQVDGVPQGANFEVFLDSDGIDKIRYGKVIRRQVEFPDAPGSLTASVPLSWVDTFPTLGLRSNWKPVTGVSKVYDNTGSSLPFAVSANAELFFASAAIRWDTPLNTDTVKSHVVLLNQGFGQCNVIICADQRFTSGLAVQFDSSTNLIHVGIVTGPTTVTYESTSYSHTVADLEDFYITFDLLTKVLAVYQGTNLTPLKTWTDTGNLVPHGPGYRYAGFSFNTGFLFSPGIEVAGWQARDN
jgi:hypothetical protein